MTTNNTPAVAEGTPVTAADLLQVNGETIQRLRSGDMTPANANAIVNATSAMLRIVKMQMDYARLTGTTPNIPMLVTSAEKPDDSKN
jgi:hypothetical protein